MAAMTSFGKKNMQTFIESRRLFWVFFSTYLYLSFASRPHESDELYGTWKKFHKKVMTWLFGTLSTDIIPQVIDLSTDI